jgi:predicted nucleotidyltransferase
MMGQTPIDLSADHKQIVLETLGAHLPRGTKAWVFGSRATGRARRYSDLDLAIDAGRRLSLDELAVLAEAFSDSDLPYKVDLVDWQSADDRWREAIAAKGVSLTDTTDSDAAR